jgi:hypothetical protein
VHGWVYAEHRYNIDIQYIYIYKGENAKSSLLLIINFFNKAIIRKEMCNTFG